MGVKNFVRWFINDASEISTADIALYLLPTAMRVRTSPASAAQFAIDTAEALQLELQARTDAAFAKPADALNSSNQ